jgi:hypothetical protein
VREDRLEAREDEKVRALLLQCGLITVQK